MYTDIIGTPCFLVFNKNEDVKKKIMVCASSITEKEIWIRSIKLKLHNTHF